jgi:nucleotide-binding universal stress UspA family protein
VARVRRILVPLDFSQASAGAAAFGAELAKRAGAAVDLLYVWRPPTPRAADGGSMLSYTQDSERLERDSAVGMMKQMRTRLAAPPGRDLFVTGDPASAIVEAAEDHAADLVIMGTHGRRGVSRFFLGSVAAQVLRQAPCPVITVRELEQLGASATTVP